MDETSITLRVELRADTLLGPGKAALLQGIRESGSIAAAGRRMGMSYKRAWYLIDTLNRSFRARLVEASKGGKAGGGARLTATGHAVIEGYRRMEAAASSATAGELARLEALLRPAEN
ncbi:molybdate transport system regulatory protein [Methylobacterium sp. PvP062]|uniref:Molybdate transport system regulatory protein n=1 Tax=Methylobacterium radiotolerans TaxID=31998 RepID=A0ABV2NL93_9HYPH|nr:MULTISPECIES: LysR family transcriptional regulator [unclassified Methylobacterium]KZC01476.1 Molybdenum-pterin-binding protein MopA [Methylobacterium radiotolerans]MBP2496075.1 molybdate transport system regulatory protein [Methylobacterium sp. PvP105]MBP2504054.1 molybdate transport system regulatory protein [Methylobacterium sp. PvP109]MCX7333150.1 LysR family transcriptional regulator [Hyphomicrobiales bacterium]